jgi:hypothetical protein
MKKLLVSVVVSMVMMLSGCLGQNALFNTVQDWNATATGEKFVNQGISFVFWWVPVYGLTLLADIVVINSIEFWSGTNPISKEGAKVAGTTERHEDGLGNYADLTYNLDGTISVSSYTSGVLDEYRLERVGDNVVKVGKDGREVIASILL